MKEVLCEKVLEERRVIERVMTVVVLEEDVKRSICRHTLQHGRSYEKTILL